MGFSQPNPGAISRSSRFRVNRPELGFSLMEMLVVLAVVGILATLLLPAIQAARETARRMECANHLKQLSLACIHHEAAENHFPTGGWYGPGLNIGDPDRGYGKSQPGGWTYNILPFMEDKALHDHGLGMSAAQKKVVLAQTAQTVLDEYYCPSRRAPMLCPNAPGMIPTGAQSNIDFFTPGARTDYAANAGSHSWEIYVTIYPVPPAPSNDGIIYAQSVIQIKDIRDGLSHTYLLGEKTLMSDHYRDGQSIGDRLPLFANFAYDWERIGATAPEKDMRGKDDYAAFGSAHRGGLNMSFCDGSVQSVGYDVDAAVFKHTCIRNDGF
ncbi:MAG: DUF1559 domain-containing protein [Thermoguttaceae bacterium]